MENRQVCDQQTHPALALLAARPELFVGQGTVAASRRGRGPQSHGPYYRLTYRDGGRQSSIYLGREGPLVEQVRRVLAALQQNRRQYEITECLRRHALASLRVHKLQVNAMLRPFGLRMKGFEVRGWRASSLQQALASLRFGSLKTGSAAKRKGHRGTTPRTLQARMQAFLDARDRKQAETPIVLRTSASKRASRRCRR